MEPAQSEPLYQVIKYSASEAAQKLDWAMKETASNVIKTRLFRSRNIIFNYTLIKNVLYSEIASIYFCRFIRVKSNIICGGAYGNRYKEGK